MDTEYDRKFADMKKYIPFLESMIERLETTSSTSEQPRRAQLDKIRSLRDLLLDQRKRMKMENLLKCEQVLVNLYAKMEQQTDIIPKMNTEKPTEKADLDIVRNKLKSVVSKSLAEEDNQSDTFEIASRSETEVLCTTLSKEPALFQRREHRAVSPRDPRVSEKPVPKRNYTRVLVSPEPNSRRWSEESQSETPLFRRRSPRKSPKKTSSTYHKKERKKSSSSKKKSKGLNITLNVPVESLNSLNSEDILSRIINCNDNDVDIDTLRDMREQILGELQQTGAGDITEAIMKSYKKKAKKSKEKKTEVEEGELSDSESEAIKSIYGSLVLVDKDKNTSEAESSHEKGKKPRKIQIRLVIDKDKGDQEPGPSKDTSVSEFELFDIESNQEASVEKCIKEKDKKSEKEECVSTKSVLDNNEQIKDQTQSISPSQSLKNTDINVTSIDDKPNPKKTDEAPKSTVPFKPNFYKSIDQHETETLQTEVKNVVIKSVPEPEEQATKNEIEVKKVDQNSESISVDVKSTDVKSDKSLDVKSTDVTVQKSDIVNKVDEKSDDADKDKKKKEDEKDKHQEVKIPLLNEDPVVPMPPPTEPVVCQIDILQALRNDILSEDIGISGGEAVTPLLHQPKVTKVANAQELVKKKITIEKYKEKSVASKKSLYYREPSTLSKEDSKKQSLKLTEKECERFNFPPKLALDDSSDDEKSPAPAVPDDIYGDLVPKSPENEDVNNTDAAPVIIPVEPVKTIILDAKKDIDMRKLPLLSPSTQMNNCPNVSSPTINLVSPVTIDLVSPPKKPNEPKIDGQPESVYRPPLVDPRLKWELNMTANSRSPNSQTISTDRNTRPLNYPNMTPSMTPSRAPSMTPNARTYEMTPSHQSFEFDDNTSRKHVYAPLLPLPIHEPLDQRETSISRDNLRQPHWEPNRDLSSPEGRPSSKWESSDQRDGHNSRKWGDRSTHREQTNEYHKSRYDSRRDRYGYSKRDDFSYSRSDCPRTPVHPFGRSDCPTTPNSSFGRNEMPLTPIHPFGRSDCPLTPSHPFGRSEHPMTPNNPFGRSEAPMTPSHPFGRSEAPMTPSHSFGRSEAPMTPSHPFGRSDYSQNMGNMFNKDPRLNRSANFESTSRNFDCDRERSQFHDRRNTLDSSRNYRERSVGRGGRGYNGEQISQRETSVGRSMSRDLEGNDTHSRDRRDNRQYARNENEGINRNDVGTNRSFQRDHSVGRGTPSVDRYRSSSRGPSNYTENTLSVEPQSGHSFTIDTSVNRTFQEFLSQKGIPPLMSSFDERRKRGSSAGRTLLRDPTSFDARRQRASSVGRALLPDLLDSFDARKQRASSVGRGLLSDPFSFDSRRQRASSVGRNFTSIEIENRNVRESSIARTQSGSKNFSRAESIGRDIGNRHGTERTLKEIKADFQSYSASFKNTFATRPEKQMKYVDPRTRKERKQTALEQKWNKQSSHNSKPYSPRKNPRDPRFRRELQNESRHDKDRDRKKHGIVYSNDNIAKGTILGPGYGVKNYKIPKIKRPVEEKVEDVKKEETKKTEAKKTEENKSTTNLDKKSKETSKTSKDTTEKTKKSSSAKDSVKNNDEKEKLNVKKESKSKPSDVEKAKPSRQSKNNAGASKFADYQEAVKNRKSKRAVISDSDSDDETKKSSKDKKNNIDKNLLKESTELDTDKSDKCSDMKSDKNEDDLLDSSFGMDDIELPDNINALIADLDNDLQTGKNDLFDKIDSPEDKEMTMEESLKDLSDLINADMDHTEDKNSSQSNVAVNKIAEEIDDEKDIVQEIEKEIKLQSSKILKEKEHLSNDSSNQQSEKESNRNNDVSSISSVVSEEPQHIHHVDGSVSSVQKCLSNETDEPQVVTPAKPEDIKQYTDNDKNENIVSTTEVGKGFTEKEAINDNEQAKPEQITETSTPDSTIDSSETPVMKEDLPDSTNEIHNEMNSDVTSSHESTETLNKSASSSKEAATELSSVENILNLLQDKSKIKQLLSMIGTDKTSENEKLKKKLEKLSEIVSEDEESNDAPSQIPDKSDYKNGSIEKEPIGSKEKVCENISDDSKIEETHEQENISIDSKIAETHEQKNICIDSKIAETNEQGDVEQTKTNFSKDNVNLDEKVLSSSPIKPRKVPGKKTKRGKKKFISEKAKRMTRSDAAAMKTSKAKPKASRELKQLQEDIKEMFIKDDVLNATGIRMCRLAKLVEDKNTNEEDDVEPRPIVVLEKFKPNEALNEKLSEKLSETKLRKKPGPRSKSKATIETASAVENKDDSKKPPQCRPGPKSKTKTATRSNEDPYEFEGDSDSYTKNSDDGFPSSDSEDESLASSVSIGSSEALAELKKKPKRKRGRGGWQSGVIKPKKKKKKIVPMTVDSSLNENVKESQKEVTIPDMNSFTDKKYSFLKNVTVYPCRLCEYSGDDIVHHYKTRHPHSEVPLSRMDPETARDAIKESEGVNLQAISKIATDRYVCRFCYREFAKRKDTILETFFWHVVSTHTGEYKQLCSECINVTRCPFNLDIPPPPKDVHGQLVGYICEKCNFTQLSLENLKTHVIVRHNDEQTSVYVINLAVMSKKMIQNAMEHKEPRVLRSSRSNQSVTEQSDDRSDANESTDYLSETETSQTKSVTESPALKAVAAVPKMRANLTFEDEDNVSDVSSVANPEGSIKKENSDDVDHDHDATENIPHDNPAELSDHVKNQETVVQKISNTKDISKRRSHGATDEVIDLPHFKVSFTDTGAKEYVCCINGVTNHYKTTLLISMKRHIQTQHKDNWDGYCSICKVIVMPQGAHIFKECFQHLLDNHFDNFPILERNESVPTKQTTLPAPPLPETVERPPTPKSYINVRPLSELISKDKTPEPEQSPALPVIESVVSLGAASVDATQVAATETDKATLPRQPTPPPRQPTPTRPPSVPPAPVLQPVDYEKPQADVIAKKQQVVLDTMMSRDKLVHIFKCAGRYCCFSTDSAEHALLHASTHQRIGGENSLICAYCDFDCSGNAIDLVTHVFKEHGSCQFACSQCFYRAVASQLVSAHMLRAHGEAANQGVVLKTATVTPSTDASTDQLTREVAVLYYTCVNAPATCKYKTYIQNKFGEHLAKHEPPFMCNMCPVGFQVATELLEHLKTHEMKLYQCTWCVFGADDEPSLMAHASARHPIRVPQAYLRVVTTREAPDGTLKMMVLPLAQFNSSVVQTELVSPSSKKDNPVKEAQRAIELEKLIGSMSAFATSSSVEQESESVSTDAGGTEDVIQAGIIQQLLPEPPRTITPAPTIRDDLSIQTTPVLKTEPVDEQAQTDVSDVINLDSDEEDSRDARPSVIDISDDDPRPRSDDDPRPRSDDLYKCSKQDCTYSCKRKDRFRKHIQFGCFKTGGPMKCAHCPAKLYTVNAIMRHYEEEHGKNNECGTCGLRDASLDKIKRHFRREHGSKDLIVASSRGNDSRILYVVKESPVQLQKTTPQKDGPSVQRQKPGPKRKLSAGNLAESPAKKKRYSPQDVDQLPSKPILDELVYCALCEFNTKVRLNLVRHLQLHAEKQPVAQSVPVNPVPHLETNEKHFDKMVNLASSSIVRASDKPARTDPEPSVNLLIPPEAASRYPKYVPERQRLTCGAPGCSYISVDEGMLKCHWETLHTGTNDYHCVHCPPYQYLVTSASKPLTAARVLSHLKMHESCLYACPSCAYYHYKRQTLEKHLNEAHQGQGQVMIVREEGTQPPAANQPPPSSGPTMDLKPWQCGLCKFKSMLRQEVVEHCSKLHNSKMQFKCPNCPFRTSTIENVTKHQSKSHPGSAEEVIYFYYREGSIPDETDGTPRWLRQRQRTGTVDPEVKEEVPDKSLPQTSTAPVLPSYVTTVDMDIVKREPDENAEVTIEDLCKKFGEFCEPNGLKYKCPLCKVVDDDSRDNMQSHLFEELQYRKWGCGMCTYKAFHKTGLSEHMLTEHRQHRDPTELPLNQNIERWVAQLLQHQTDLIAKTKENFAKQKIQMAKPRAAASASRAHERPVEAASKSREELEQAFGPLGVAKDSNYCCPKCPFKTKDHSKMQDHLESELNKIRWRCSNCGNNFQEYHEAQLHCRTVHGIGARPVEALRDPAVRAAWVSTALRVQREALSDAQDSPVKPSLTAVPFVPAADPLLEVRFERNVPTPEEEMLARRKRPLPSPSKPDSDDDDERLVIDEEDEFEPKKKSEANRQCPHCDFSTRYVTSLVNHQLRHYNLKPYTCGYCDYNCFLTQCKAHNESVHPHLRHNFFKTIMPTGPPTNLNLIKKGKRILSTDSDQAKPKEDKPKEDTKAKKEDTKAKESKDEALKVQVVCLVCDKLVLESDCPSHTHENIPVNFGKKGEIVVKCCNCWLLLPNVETLQAHHSAKHPKAVLNYAYYKLGHNTREILACDYCDKRFKFLRDMKSHHNSVHGNFILKYSLKPYTVDDVHTIELQDEEMTVETVTKRVARKSTTKLPTQSVAKKSTTKLPFFYVESDSESDEEYSYYGDKPPSLGDYPNVTTVMPFCNKPTTFSVKQLSEIIKVNPKVIVKDINRNKN